MKKTLFATLLGMTLAAGAASAAVRFGVGVNFGAPAPVMARPVMARPPMPGPGYVWVDGYNGPNGFVAGCWEMPPFDGAFWVAPRFDGGRFVAGYWGGRRVVDTHNNFRAVPMHDDHFRARTGHFNDRNDHFQNSRDDHARDFRR